MGRRPILLDLPVLLDYHLPKIAHIFILENPMTPHPWLTRLSIPFAAFSLLMLVHVLPSSTVQADIIPGHPARAGGCGRGCGSTGLLPADPIAVVARRAAVDDRQRRGYRSIVAGGRGGVGGTGVVAARGVEGLFFNPAQVPGEGTGRLRQAAWRARSAAHS